MSKELLPTPSKSTQELTESNPEVAKWSPSTPSGFHVCTSGTPSPDGGAYSLLFTGLSLNLPISGPSELTASYAFEFPITASTAISEVHADVRGGTIKSSGTRILICIELLDELQTIKQSYGSDVNNELFVSFKTKIAIDKEGKYLIRGTVFLSVQSSTNNQSGFVGIDSIEFNLLKKGIHDEK